MFGWILNGLLFFLSYFVPKRKGLLVLGSRRGESFAENPKYLFLHSLRNDVGFDVVWVSRSHSVMQKILDLGGSCERIDSLHGFWLALRAQVLVIEQNALDVSYAPLLFGRFRIVHTWHGTPMKHIGADVPRRGGILERFRRYVGELQHRMLWMIITPSDKEKGVIEGAFRNSNVFVTGYPRNDVLFDSTLAQSNLKEEIGNAGTVVLYAPTFRPYEVKPFSDSFLKRLDAWCKKNDTVFLIKKHPYDHSLCVDSCRFVRDVSSAVDDIQELLLDADIVISDYSGVVFDFALLGRPIIFYAYDIDRYERDVGLYYDYFSVMPGPFAHDENGLLEILSDVGVFEDKKYRRKYAEFARRFNQHEDANSSARFYEQIRKSL